jgi:hypothetical protein
MMRKTCVKETRKHSWMDVLLRFSNGETEIMFGFFSDKRRRREKNIGNNNNGDSVRIQTSENQKKTLNFLFLSFCVHIHKERDRCRSGYWLRIVGFLNYGSN